MLRAEGIVKRYRGVPALDGVTIEAAPGAITALIGPNGSGKSTLFDVITGVTRLDAGRLTVNGVELQTNAPERVARAGVVRTFQIPRVAKRMTTLENLMMCPFDGAGESVIRLFSPRQRRRIREDEERRLRAAWEMAEALGLRSVANDLAGGLSGGQVKLLSAGMAILTRPEVLLLDEPTAGVNPVAIESLAHMLLARRDAGLGTLIIEHNMAVVANLCNTVYVLHAGKLLAHGTPDEVRRNALVMDAYLGRVVSTAT